MELPWVRIVLIALGILCQFASGEQSTAPEQIHLALGKEQGSMSVSWVTHAPAASHVQFGTVDSGELSQQVSGESTRYDFQISAHQNYASPYLHSAIMTGLQPLTQYSYRCGDAAGELSEIRSFLSMPSVGDDMGGFTLGVVGDIGTTMIISVLRVCACCVDMVC